MAEKDKPYRVYRGGRVKGPIRYPVERERRPARHEGDGRYPGPEPIPRKKRRWGRIALVLVLVAIVAAAAWAALGYLALRSGVREANERLDPRAERALAPQDGTLLSSPSTLLLLGTDRGPGRGREGPSRSDAIVLVRTDPDEHRIALLSIPRDLRVEIPGHGPDKINVAYALGGAVLALKTVENVTGLEINHVAVLDFGSFGEVIDALGGVTVDVPKRIVSNPFDCPFKTPAECRRWKGWRFAPGEQRMDGRRALVYARVRENRLDPNESDLTRGGRQQQVIQAIADEAMSFRTFLRLPLVADDLAKPLTTDLSAVELLQLAWVKFRTPTSGQLRCRLGGTPTQIGDASYVIGSEENVSVIAMVTGKAAPQPPLPGSGPYGPGCLVGHGTP